jgi:predicted neuraminidase
MKIFKFLLITCAAISLSSCCTILKNSPICSVEIKNDDFTAPEVEFGQLIFPYQNQHTHGSTIVELPNGDLLAAWFQGSGEKSADDVKIMGARLKNGKKVWSDPFMMYDSPKFPDINPVLFIDDKKNLWLFSFTVLAYSWDTSLIKYMISDDYYGNGAPKWKERDTLLVYPGSYSGKGIAKDDIFVEQIKNKSAQYCDYFKEKNRNAKIDIPISGDREVEIQTSKNTDKLTNLVCKEFFKYVELYADGKIAYSLDIGDINDKPLFRRIVWETRNKPIQIGKRILLPVYSDGMNLSMMVYSDDYGKTWNNSEPLVGIANIQPSLVQGRDGVITAFMRNNGIPPKVMQISKSKDDGQTWSTVQDGELPNNSSALSVTKLSNGNWVIAYNDSIANRASLVVALSDDEGKTWKYKRHIQYIPSKIAGYPTIYTGKNDILHITFSAVVTKPKVGEAIKYFSFDEAWIKEGDPAIR